MTTLVKIKIKFVIMKAYMSKIKEWNVPVGKHPISHDFISRPDTEATDNTPKYVVCNSFDQVTKSKLWCNY